MIRTVCASTAALLAVSLSATVPAQAENVQGQELKSLVSGKRIYLQTPFGGEFPLYYQTSGVVSGDGTALGLGKFMAPKEKGKWWVNGANLCQQWPTWYDGKTSCFTITPAGPGRIGWVRDDGTKGRARIDATGNVRTDDGTPWIGGHPFPATTNGLEAMAGQTLAWGRHDATVYVITMCDVSVDGNIRYSYEGAWAEMQATGRVAMDPKPHMPGKEDLLRFQAVYFTAPHDVRGTSFLNTWYYDQQKFPDLFGYVPTFKRVRRFPTNQRFEPMLPGTDLYLSDAWAAGDPYLTWGNFKVVETGPFLAPLAGNWSGADPNWTRKTHGGPKGLTFFDTAVELVPQTIVVESEPVGYPRAPISKKWVRFDLRTMLPVSMVSFDRRGQPFRSFDGAYSLYDDGTNKVMDGAHPYWSWSHIHAFNTQTRTMTRLEQRPRLDSGDVMRVNDPDIYDAYLTQSSLQRRGF